MVKTCRGKLWRELKKSQARKSPIIFDIQQLSSPGFLPSFRMADSGFSTGPNTFLAVQTILKAEELKFQSLVGINHPEFQVFFNDLVNNDFNNLFACLSLAKGDTFQPEFLNPFTACSFRSPHFILLTHLMHTLYWLSTKLLQRHYMDARLEVSEACSAQFATDVEDFLLERAHELVIGGSIVLMLPAVTDKIIISPTSTGLNFQVFESCLVEMAKKELETVIQKNGHYFTTERIEILVHPRDAAIFEAKLKQSTLHMRAVFEGMISKHFGIEVANESFDE